MSGALNSVFGGGNILGLVMNVVSLAFPPLQIAMSLSNLFTQTLGQALNAGIDILQQQFGLPKFVADLAKNFVNQAVASNQKATDPQVDQFVADKAGATAQAWGTDFTQQFVDKVVDNIKEGSDSTGSKKKTASSWLEVIALSMAEAMSQKSAKMIDLSKEIKDLSRVEIDSDDTQGQKENAADMQAAQASLNATGKEFEMLTNTMKSVVDSIGNSLAQAARKS
ncbi:hypothetical protein CKO44_12800 [Rubrivivax gelatinosus]|uniref:Uncharacterized protein n=1 Tax=Rubrivivax gelatinosus TaxID=28068 RepID=A0ABS1E1X8_RUBGE|nr:hypothetical protein [Rubrivivax gelatinosus]MBK1614347.1 hypothetical protein [Rubrivivax gelatinosus]MBK1715723.1 hypothetical protein [Rubrivivax gelatinosus]MBZ8143197.1 hypothetical protein [Rubrivivax gelatinosus]